MFLGHSYGVLITINLLNVFTLLEEKKLEEFSDWIKDLILEKRCIKFIWNRYNSSRELHTTIVKNCFYNKGSTLTENIRYFMYKIEPVLCGILKELCAIRDNTSSCYTANSNDIVALINDNIMYSLKR